MEDWRILKASRSLHFLARVPGSSSSSPFPLLRNFEYFKTTLSVWLRGEGEEKEGERGRNRERDRGGEIGRDKEEESRRRGEDWLYCFLRAKKKEREGGEEREDLPVEYCITFHRSAGSVIRSFLLQTFTLLSLLPWPGKALIASH